MDYDNIDKVREERKKIFDNIEFTEKALRDFTDIKPILVSKIIKVILILLSF